MRKLSAAVCLALIVGISLAQPGNDTPGTDQDATPAPVSSLEFGAPFDARARQAFEQQLTPEQHERLVRLNARFALADAECPLPEDPSQPFYLKLHGDMTRALADSLERAGAGFIGYANPHTHILRARDADSVQVIRTVINTSPLVAGTLLQRPEDKLAPDLAAFALTSSNRAGEFEVLFWRDVEAAEARALMTAANALILEATVDADGEIDLDTPCLTCAVREEGFAALLASPLVEFIGWMGVKQTDNQTSAAMANADPATIGVNPYNLDGTGQIVGVWDQGPARDTHNDFQNAPVQNPLGIGSKRVLKVDTSTVSNHGTHVTGTIVGDGTADTSIHATTGQPEARGYAFRALALSHNWNNVDQQRRNAKHNWNHVADNHSYSTTTNWGGYSGATQQKDFTNRDYFLVMCQSAGNYATNSSRPYADGSMTVFASNAHRNGLVVANARDNEDINSSSSRGPAADGRLVPQFAANGTGLRSPINSSGDSGYDSYTGTSMSSPSVCGSVVLLSQLWRREHNDRALAPDVVRAVLALTCRDKYNTGPDYRYGFGIVDVQAAADLILANKQNGRQIVRGAVRSGGQFDYPLDVTSSAQPLRVVLSWLDVYASTSANVTLVNDLDIELIDPTGNTTHYPFAGLTGNIGTGSETHVFTTGGPNTRDNIELVHVDNPMTGTWTLRVKGTSIPANAQSGFPNDVQGYVIASSHEIGAQQLKFEDSLNGNTPVAIPDNDTTGITRSFTVSDLRVITGVRVITRIVHERRGDVEIILRHPSNTQVVLKSQDSGPEDDYTDIIGVFPDTRQPDEDVTALMCLPVQGTWRVQIRDLASGNTGALHYLALELDVRVNTPPVADAGAGFDVREGAGGQLDGGSSGDADGDPITLAWVQTGGIPVSLSSSSAAQPMFTAPSVAQDEVVTFQLTVTDCAGAFDTDTVQVTILNNLAPLANAGPDIVLLEGDPGQLDGSATADPENDPVTYAWVQTGGAPLALSSSTVPQPTFTAPAVAQNEVFTFVLTATDSYGDFTSDTVQVTVEHNLPPVAHAGANIALAWGAPGQLDGGASYDPNAADTITYQWTQISGAATVILSDSTNPQPAFTAPLLDDVLEFELTVTDSKGLFTSDIVLVYVNETGTLPISSGGGGKKSGGGCSSGEDGSTWWLILSALAAATLLRRRATARRCP
jgi:MYXO-CTERM domain-containing protein